MKIERYDRDYLINYARFVQTQEYDEEYKKRAIKEIPFIAALINQELIRDGRQGACVDVSMALSRILEAEGFWNYIVNVSLTLAFSASSNVLNKYFWAVDPTNKSNNGHVWVAAPPFNIIDLTIRQQPYTHREKDYLPDMIISQSQLAKFSARNIYLCFHQALMLFLL